MSENTELAETAENTHAAVVCLPFRIDSLPVAIDYVAGKQYLYLQARHYLEILMDGYNKTGVMNRDFIPTLRASKEILDSIGEDLGDERRQLGDELMGALVKTIKKHPDVMKEIKQEAADAARQYLAKRNG